MSYRNTGRTVSYTFSWELFPFSFTFPVALPPGVVAKFRFQAGDPSDGISPLDGGAQLTVYTTDGFADVLLFGPLSITGSSEILFPYTFRVGGPTKLKFTFTGAPTGGLGQVFLDWSSPVRFTTALPDDIVTDLLEPLITDGGDNLTTD